MKVKEKQATEYSGKVEEWWNARLEAKKGYLAGFNACKQQMEDLYDQSLGGIPIIDATLLGEKEE